MPVDLESNWLLIVLVIDSIVSIFCTTKSLLTYANARILMILFRVWNLGCIVMLFSLFLMQTLGCG